MKIENKSVGIIIGIILMVFAVESAEAIPAFARKYKTSCATCHMVFPRLTPFGEAYRINGYRMPEIEEESVKEDPVSMGAEAYKEVWPDAIWPGNIPGTSPIAFRINYGFSYDNSNTKTPSKFTIPAIQLFMGGTFSEKISFFGSVLLVKGHNTNALQMVSIVFNDLFSKYLPEHAFNLRIGQFVPDLTTYKNKHRALTYTPYALNTYVPSMGSYWAPGNHQRFGIAGQVIGMEASGLLTKRMRYVIGLSNGNALMGEDNKAKDVFGKVAYKFGGMAFDGSSTGEIFGASADNWSEKSITLSAFAYYSTRLDKDNAKDISLQRFGGDVNIFFRDLNVVGGFITGTDEDYFNRVKIDREYNVFFLETNYMIYPWLAGVFRFEQANPMDIDSESFDSVSRYIINISALYTANVKFSIETRINPDIPEEKNLFIGLDYAF